MAAILTIGAFGTLIGSFLNVVIHRVPLGRSVVSPASACGDCGHVIRAYDNIPVVSWLLLRGRCRDCGSRISARYPLVEVGAAVLFGVVALRFVPEIGSGSAVAGVLQLVAYLYLAAVSIALALIDMDVRRLPNVLVVPSFGVMGALFAAASLVSGEWTEFGLAIIGVLVLGGGYLLIALVKPGGMGMGDVKLAALLGAALGWLGAAELAVGAFAGIALGGVYALVLLVAGRGRRAAIAYGPWLLAGAWVGILAGEPIASAYLRLFGL